MVPIIIEALINVVYVVVTVSKFELIFDHIMGSKNISFWPTLAFQRGISNAICDLVLCLLK